MPLATNFLFSRVSTRPLSYLGLPNLLHSAALRLAMTSCDLHLDQPEDLGCDLLASVLLY